MNPNQQHLDIIIQQIKQISQATLINSLNTIERERKADGSFITQADLSMQQQIIKLLQQYFPHIAVLGEEMTQQEQLAIVQQPQAFWCLDPIDGTSNYSTGLPYFAVSLALIEKGKTLWGMVYDPCRDECFTAAQNQGAFLNGKSLVLDNTLTSLKQALALIDFKKMDNKLATSLITQQPWASQRSLGSIALDWCWLAADRCQIYFHSRHSLWDFAAATLIFREAGGYYATLKGKELDFFSLKKQVVIAAVNKTLFDCWQNYLQQLTALPE